MPALNIPRPVLPLLSLLAMLTAIAVGVMPAPGVSCLGGTGTPLPVTGARPVIDGCQPLPDTSRHPERPATQSQPSPRALPSRTSFVDNGAGGFVRPGTWAPNNQRTTH